MLALLLAHRGLAARPMHTSFHRPCPGVGSGDLLGPTETYPEILCQFSSVPSPFSYAVRNFRRKSSPYAFAILACRRRTAKHCLHYLLKRSNHGAKQSVTLSIAMSSPHMWTIKDMV